MREEERERREGEEEGTMKGGRDYGAMNFMAKGKEGGIRES